MSSLKNLLLKNTFKVTLQYLFNVFILFNTVSYIEINLKLKVDPKMCTFKNLKKFGTPGKSFEKTSGKPVVFRKLLFDNPCTTLYLSLT